MHKLSETSLKIYEKEAGWKDWYLASSLAMAPFGAGNIGTVIGSASAAPEFQQTLENYKNELIKDPSQIKTFVQKSTQPYLPVHIANKPEQISPFLTGRAKWIANTPLLNKQMDPNILNAFVLPTNKGYVLGSPTAGIHPQALGHEIGHMLDFRNKKTPSKWNRGFWGALNGKQLAMERRAWNLSPIKSQGHPLRNAALKTYQRAQTGARAGFGAGLLGSLAGLGTMLRRRRTKFR